MATTEVSSFIQMLNIVNLTKINSSATLILFHRFPNLFYPVQPFMATTVKISLACISLQFRNSNKLSKFTSRSYYLLICFSFFSKSCVRSCASFLPLSVIPFPTWSVGAATAMRDTSIGTRSCLGKNLSKCTIDGVVHVSARVCTHVLTVRLQMQECVSPTQLYTLASYHDRFLFNSRYHSMP